MKVERANVRRDCTVALPPNVVETLGLVCGKNAVEFTIFDVTDQEDTKYVPETMTAAVKKGALIFVAKGK